MVVAIMGPHLPKLSLLLRSNSPTNVPICSVLKYHIRDMKTGCVGRQKTLPANCLFHGPCDAGGPRVFAISDLHTDYSDNMAWVARLSTEWYKKDVLIVAGDVAETYRSFVLTLSELKERFQRVFYVPGNHDLWCRREGDDHIDSLEKLNALLDACSKIGVETRPGVVDGLGIIPLFSWYHEVIACCGSRFRIVPMFRH